VRCLAVLDLGGTQRSEHLHPSFVSPADRLDTLLRDEDRIARATRQAASSSATSGAAAGIRRNASAAVEAADAREEAHRRARDAGFQNAALVEAQLAIGPALGGALRGGSSCFVSACGPGCICPAMLECGSADCGRFDANHVDRAATPFQCRRGPSLLASRGTAGYRPGHHEPCSLVL